MRKETVKRVEFISAPPSLLYSIITDCENYPKFFSDFKKLTVLSVEDCDHLVDFDAVVGVEMSYKL